MVILMYDSYSNWINVSKTKDISNLKSLITGTERWDSDYITDDCKAILSSFKGAVVDFGCGLGRNVSMLKYFNCRIVGYDIPNMISRLKKVESAVANLYDALYDSFDCLLKKEDPTVIYESVVLQHIVDGNYINMLNSIAEKQSVKLFVSIANSGGSTRHIPHLSNLVFLDTPNTLHVYLNLHIPKLFYVIKQD